MEHVPAIISALTALFLGLLAHRLKVIEISNKKGQQIVAETKLKTKRAIKRIYTLLTILRDEIDADRVHIIQPHPTKKGAYISMSYEITGKGVPSLQYQLQAELTSKYISLVKNLSERNCIVYQDVTKDVKCPDTKRLLALNDASTVVIKRLQDVEGDWVGSLFVEWGAKQDIDLITIKQIVSAYAEKIEPILPDYE